MYDILIVGGGPAGLTAAVYGRRANRSVLVIEKETFGGQITFSPMVENIPGFTALSGNAFAEKLVDQAVSQGAEFESDTVTGIEAVSADGVPAFVAHGESGDYEGRTVVIASGARHRMLGLPGEDAYVGNGISFCAVCDGAFYRDQTVGVVGGGNSALQEAVLLSELVRKLYIFQDLPVLTGEKKLQEILASRGNVEVITGVHVTGLLGTADADGGAAELSGVTLTHADGRTEDVALSGLFVAIGLVPQNEPFQNLFALNAWGYADADESCRTRTPGVFVAGDCRSKRVRQVATAAADGAVAALAACDFLDGK